MVFTLGDALNDHHIATRYHSKCQSITNHTHNVQATTGRHQHLKKAECMNTMAQNICMERPFPHSRPTSFGLEEPAVTILNHAYKSIELCLNVPG